jgi:ATP-dependent DNA ligase
LEVFLVVSHSNAPGPPEGRFRSARHPQRLAFGLLSLDGRPLLDEPYSARRALLEGLG